MRRLCSGSFAAPLKCSVDSSLSSGNKPLPNPFNPLNWIKSAQDWFTRTERSSGFRPFLIYLMLSLGAGVVLLTILQDRIFVDVLAFVLIAFPVLSFVPLFLWKALSDPDFCRSESHVQRLKKYELEALGTESRQIQGEIFEQKAITASVKEPHTEGDV